MYHRGIEHLGQLHDQIRPLDRGVERVEIPLRITVARPRWFAAKRVDALPVDQRRTSRNASKPAGPKHCLHQPAVFADELDLAGPRQRLEIDARAQLDRTARGLPYQPTNNLWARLIVVQPPGPSA